MSAAVLAGWLALGVASAAAQSLTPVPSANPRAPGVVAPNVLSVELQQVLRATGSMLLENPQSPATYYGYNDDKPNLVPLPPPAAAGEAHKTEPDKNTYLVLRGQRGADPGYDYGTRFLFQGHESGAGGQGYITRINLDADVAHRVTLMATKDAAGVPLPVFDGSTWYPWAQRLLFTAELGNLGGVWQATLDVPSEVEDISGVTGRGGYEGIQADPAGIAVEDAGDGRHTQRNALDSAYLFDRAHGLLEPGESAGPDPRAGPRRLRDHRRAHARIGQRRRQRDHRHPRLRRGRRRRGPPRREEAPALQRRRQVAHLLDAAARGQQHVRDHLRPLVS